MSVTQALHRHDVTDETSTAFPWYDAFASTDPQTDPTTKHAGPDTYPCPYRLRWHDGFLRDSKAIPGLQTPEVHQLPQPNSFGVVPNASSQTKRPGGDDSETVTHSEKGQQQPRIPNHHAKTVEPLLQEAQIQNHHRQQIISKQRLASTNEAAHPKYPTGEFCGQVANPRVNTFGKVIPVSTNICTNVPRDRVTNHHETRNEFHSNSRQISAEISHRPKNVNLAMNSKFSCTEHNQSDLVLDKDSPNKIILKPGTLCDCGSTKLIPTQLKRSNSVDNSFDCVIDNNRNIVSRDSYQDNVDIQTPLQTIPHPHVIGAVSNVHESIPSSGYGQTFHLAANKANDHDIMTFPIKHTGNLTRPHRTAMYSSSISSLPYRKDSHREMRTSGDKNFVVGRGRHGDGHVMVTGQSADPCAEPQLKKHVLFLVVLSAVVTTAVVLTVMVVTKVLPLDGLM